MALVGPAMSFILAGIFTLFWWVVGHSSVSGPSLVTLKEVTADILYYAALVNTILGVFNLIPAFLTDRGRILRAVLVGLKRDYDKATKDSVSWNTNILWIYGIRISDNGFGFVS
jgi:Zn-dependent protease